MSTETNTKSEQPSTAAEGQPQLISAKTLAYIHQLLKERPLFFFFENDIESRFYAKRAEEYRRLLSVGKLLFFVLYGIIAAIAMLAFPNVITADDLFILKFVLIPIGALLILVLLVAEKPFFRTNYQWLSTPVSTLILFCIMMASVSTIDSDFAQHAAYDVIIIVTIISFGLRVLFPVCVLIICLAGILTILTTISLNWKIDWFKFSHYYGLGSFITLMIVGLIERQERFAFLQEIIVAHQTVELDRLNKALDRISREDPLTGLANRRAFDETLQKEWERAKRDQQSIALLYMDVDFFKLYNDTYGHNIGDVCLRRVGQTIKQALRRPADLAARYGGEEFVVLLPNTNVEGAIDVAQRIIKHIDALALPHSRSKAAPHVTLSIGVTHNIPRASSTLTEFLAKADAALYKAKEHGRHQYQFDS
ncbi:diguanylate cyclase [Agitococcus lubricus]|uniref:diguanylate cyclase n=1 Tax=Agitococcus lubricus TaxID=1077255 RepID=UPI0011B1F255|nr:diguanylate cyclase [Agitococcus lubricus]